MFGVIAGGEQGVVHALSLIRAKVDRDLGLLGCPSVGGLNPEFLQLGDLFPQGLPAREAGTRQPMRDAANF